VAAAEQSIVIDVPRDAFMAVIADYERYPEFLRDMKETRVVQREEGIVDVAFTLHLVKRIEYTLRLIEDAPNGLSWTQVDGDFKRNEGGWTLQDLDGERTRATYRIDVLVGVFVPGSIVNRLVGQTLPDTLHAFKVRAEGLSRP
jgi:coenzyme Q-binding protein COQ10